MIWLFGYAISLSLFLMVVGYGTMTMKPNVDLPNWVVRATYGTMIATGVFFAGGMLSLVF